MDLLKMAIFHGKVKIYQNYQTVNPFEFRFIDGYIYIHIILWYIHEYPVIAATKKDVEALETKRIFSYDFYRFINKRFIDDYMDYLINLYYVDT